MDHPNLQRPHVEETPGAWPETPAESTRTASTAGTVGRSTPVPVARESEAPAATPSMDDAPETPRASAHAPLAGAVNQESVASHNKEIQGDASGASTPVFGADEKDAIQREDSAEIGTMEPIKSGPKSSSNRKGSVTKQSTRKESRQEDLFKALSRKRTNASTNSQDTVATDEENAEIERLMSRMFGKTRQAHSEEEKTRHVGVVFKHLTVKGMGLGAALQPTIGDVFMGLPRLIGGLFGKGKKVGGKPPVRTIINDFNGCVKPGEMLLVLGKPGSGCSTFLKVLGNQRFGYESVEGDVTYGGADAAEMQKNFRGEVLYNPEDDLHYATLKVKDTLTFALRTRTPGKDSRAEGETRAQYVKEFLRVISKLFWIEHTMGTKVGNEFIRGVSGGEKKRVSIAEAMITKASTQCWDNSTRGLDASTALEYVQSLRSLTNMAHVSTCVALYQAGETLYDLFDKVILIDEGKCAYFGSTEDAKPYFLSLGFTCPSRWTTADFLTSVTDEHERNVRDGWENRIPRTPAEFETAYKNSDAMKRNVADIEEFEAHVDEQKAAREAATKGPAKQRNYTIPFYKQVMACTNRQVKIMYGDPVSLGGKWGGILFQSLIVGSLFYNLPATSAGVFPRGGVLFFMLLFNALLALAEMTSAFGSRPILLKHKSFSFYRPSAYAIAQVVVDVPLVLVQVFIFDIVVYFMAHLSRTASQFFISLLFLFILTMTMYSFFRAVGSLCTSLDVATRITGVAIQALIVYTGYLIPPKKMHPWFKWLIWVNPVQYGFESLMANEFTGLDIICEAPFLVPLGPGAQPQYQSCTIQGSQPGSTIVHGADYIDTAFTYKRSHLWRNFGIVVAFWLFFVALTMIGMEMQKPNKGGGAVTIFKRGKAPKALSKAIDQGEIPSDEEKAEKETNIPTSSDDESDGERAIGTVAKNDVIFTWTGVNYTIPYEKGQRQLLQDCQGYVRPGKLTALMGASGAGKTTLLNTLAQRINFGVIEGEFLVDGAPLPLSFQRATGFAEQQDIHEATSTVREALQFSALLRQPKEVPIKEKYAYVETIIHLLEMQDIAGATIGKIGSGLNVEQRKRVTIGVELASKPSLLMFLDEPTSGLDSQAAFNILRFLRKLANAGQAILCTIHQPSSVLFEEFDELILLKSGGRIVYHGELGKDSSTLIAYLEENGSGKCPPKANPAEFMLSAIGAGDPDYDGQDWGDVWANSRNHQERTEEIQEMIRTRRKVVQANKAETIDDREYAMPISTQVMAVVRRSFVSFWRTPEYMIGKFSLHIITGLFNTFTFFRLGNSQIDMQSRLFSVFMTLTISPPLIQQLQPKFLAARNIYNGREAKAKIYSWFAFCCGATIVEIPYSLVAGTIYWCCWYWGVGFPRDTFTSAYVWMMIMVFELFYVGFGQAIASFAPNELLASLLVPVFFLFVVSFCGIVVPYAALPYFWRSWMYDLTPFRYLLEGLLGAVVHNIPVVCSASELARFPPPPGQTCQQYTAAFISKSGGYVQNGTDGLCEFCQYANGDQFAASFNVFYKFVWRDYGIFWAYAIFNFSVVFIASYLFLGGWKKIKSVLSPTARKNKQLQRVKSNIGHKA